MKVSRVTILIVSLLALTACSGEEQPPPQTPSPKVVKPIKPSTADIEKPTTTFAEEKKPKPEEKKPQAEEKVAMEKPAPAPEKPAPAPEKPEIAPKPEAEEKKAAMEEPTAAQAKKIEKDQPGIYRVKKGDSLSSISARADVLKDALKWPILLRLNRDKMQEWAAGDDLPDQELPQGTELKVITAREARASLKKPTGTVWVANVLSTTSHAEIVPPAVALVKQGYPVYIVRANVKGKEYMRLRVGFFKNRSEADEAGKKIKEQLNFQDSWSTRADKEEYEEVAGFFKSTEKR